MEAVGADDEVEALLGAVGEHVTCPSVETDSSRVDIRTFAPTAAARSSSSRAITARGIPTVAGRSSPPVFASGNSAITVPSGVRRPRTSNA